MHSNASKARLLAARSDGLRSRVRAVSDQRAAIVAAHRNGTISDGAFLARLATLSVRSRSLGRLANRSAAAAADLPSAVRRQYGVDPGALRALGVSARGAVDLSETPAAAAVAGSHGRSPFGVTPPSTSGRGAVSIESANRAVSRAAHAVNATDASVGRGSRARSELATARRALAAARNANAAGNSSLARSLAANASAHAATAHALATATSTGNASAVTPGRGADTTTSSSAPGTSVGVATTTPTTSSVTNVTSPSPTNVTVGGNLTSFADRTR